MKQLTLFFSVLLSAFVSGQSIPKWANPSKAFRIPYYASILSQDSFAVVKELREVEVHADLNRDPVLLFPGFSGDRKKIYFFNEGIFRLGNRLLLFTSIDDSNKEKCTLFVHQLDDTAGQHVPGTELFSFSYRVESRDPLVFLADVLLWDDPGWRKSGNGFDFKLSSNGEYICVIYYSEMEYGYLLLNKDLQMMHKGSLMEYATGRTAVEDLKVSDSGELFLLVSDKSKPADCYLYRLNAGDPVKIPLGLAGKGLTNLSLAEDLQKRVVVSGIKLSKYEKYPSNDAAGVFCMLIDPDKGTVIAENTSFFTRDFILEGYTEKDVVRLEKFWAKKKTEPGIRNLRMLKFEVLSGGGYLALAEQVTVYDENAGTDNWDPNNQVRSFLYEDLVLIRLDPDGNMLWSRKVQKHQECKSYQPESFASAAFLQAGGNYYLLFNDHLVNYHAETKEFSPKKRVVGIIPQGLSVIACVKFDLETGEQERFVLDETAEHFMLIPKFCLPDPLHHKMLLYTWNTKLGRWGSVNFE